MISLSIDNTVFQDQGTPEVCQWYKSVIWSLRSVTLTPQWMRELMNDRDQVMIRDCSVSEEQLNTNPLTKKLLDVQAVYRIYRRTDFFIQDKYFLQVLQKCWCEYYVIRLEFWIYRKGKSGYCPQGGTQCDSKSYKDTKVQILFKH